MLKAKSGVSNLGDTEITVLRIARVIWCIEEHEKSNGVAKGAFWN